MLEVEKDFEKFMREPEITLYMDGMKTLISPCMHEATRSVLKCAFMEGMKYAHKRCDAEGHGK